MSELSEHSEHSKHFQESDAMIQLIKEIDFCLNELLKKTNASCIVLSDIAGQVITTAGSAPKFDPAKVGTLASGVLAATAELARKIDDSDTFNIQCHEGKTNNLCMATSGKSFVLVVVFEVSVAIGLVRLYTRRALKELAQFSHVYEETIESATASLRETSTDTLLEVMDAFFETLK